MNKLLLTIAITMALTGCGTVDDYGTSQEDVNNDLQEQIDDINNEEAQGEEQEPNSPSTPQPTPTVNDDEPVVPTPDTQVPEPDETPTPPPFVVVTPEPTADETPSEVPSVSESDDEPYGFPHFDSWTHLNNRLDLEGGREVGCYNASMTYSSWTSHGFSFTFPSAAYDESYYSQRVNDWIDHVGDSNWRYTNLIVVQCSVDIPNYADPIVRRDNTQRIDGAESALYYVDNLEGWILYIHEDLPPSEQQYAYSWSQWAIHKQTTSEYNWNQSYAKQLWCETWGEC